MLSNGKELLGELYGRDHLTYEEIEDLELTVVTENGETVSPEELRGKSKEHGDHGERHDPLLPSSDLFVGVAGAGDGDRTGSRSAQVTGLLPALPQARGREMPARQWQDPEDRSRRTNRLLLPCMPT
jgi:hypothetical protein